MHRYARGMHRYARRLGVRVVSLGLASGLAYMLSLFVGMVIRWLQRRWLQRRWLWDEVGSSLDRGMHCS